jgi:uncharacterized membrane protein
VGGSGYRWVCFVGHVIFRRGGGNISMAVVREYSEGCVLFIIIMGMFLLFGRIWGYVYLQRCHSFVIFVYLNFICGIVQVYLAIGPLFNVFLVFGRLCICVCLVSSIC